MKLTDHQVKTEFIIERGGALSRELSFDVKAAGCEDDCE